jgi:RNA polymerase sigma-70 factor (ECF subfamily)
LTSRLDSASKPDPAESDLVTRIQAGDAAAFGVLFTEHFASLCGLVMSYVRNAAVAEELVQDLFCAIWHRREEWRPSGRVRHYLLVAARNRAISYLRHEQVAERQTRGWFGAGASARADDPPAMGRRFAEPDQDAEAAELAEACREAIHALPERQRLVVTLRWQHRLSHGEIAHALGISVKGVENQLTRAHKSLRKYLERFRG